VASGQGGGKVTGGGGGGKKAVKKGEKEMPKRNIVRLFVWGGRKI